MLVNDSVRFSDLSTMTLLRYGNCKGVHHKIKFCTLEDQVQKLIENDDNSLIDLEEEVSWLVFRGVEKIFDSQ